MKVSARFKGTNGSCGYFTNHTYELTLRTSGINNSIMIVGTAINVPYDSLKAFLSNWSNVTLIFLNPV